MRHIPQLLLLSMLLFSGIFSAMAETHSCPSSSEIFHMEVDVLDTLSLSNCDAMSLLLIFGAAEYMLVDSSSDVQLKADICLSLIADDIQRRSKEETFDSQEPAMAFLLRKLESQQYNLALNQPSDWAKLLHYMKEGRWSYISQRFFDRNIHLYLMGFLSLGFLFFLGKKKLRKDHSKSVQQNASTESLS